MSYNEVRPIFESFGTFKNNQKFCAFGPENTSKKQMSPEKEKSPEKIMKEKAVTQEKKEEVPKEPTAKRKKSLPRKTTKKETKIRKEIGRQCVDESFMVLSSPLGENGKLQEI
ncbi:hypothetical protein Tco_0212453 [Tanacetum coccineum]